MEVTLEELGRNSFIVIQPKNGFRFGMDSVLLADFARVKRGERIVDLCAGCGAISLMLAAREENCEITAVEIDPLMADLVRQNAELNGIEERLGVCQADVRQCPKILGYGAFSLAVCNPPYFKGEGSPSKHLGEMTLLEIAASASALVKPRGRACFVFPAADILDMCFALKEKRLEPKRMRCVSHDLSHACKLILIEAVKNASPGIDWMPPLLTGVDAAEMRAIYNL